MNPGDLAVVGWSAVANSVELAVLARIPAGTVLQFTDRGWSNTTRLFTTNNSTDGTVTWTAAADILPGTLLRLSLPSSTGASAITLRNLSTDADLTSAISVSGFTGGDKVPTVGDNFFITEGSGTALKWLWGLNSTSTFPQDANGWNTGTITPSSASASNLPNGTDTANALANGTHAVGFVAPQLDHLRYTGPTTAASAAAWATRLANAAHWTGDDTGSVASTLSLAAGGVLTLANTAPSASATALNPTYAEDSTTPSTLFSQAAIDPKQAGQRVNQIQITVAGVADGAAEQLWVQGTAVQLTQGSSATASGSPNVQMAVSVSGSTATVTLTPATAWTAAQAQTVVNGLAYSHSGQAFSGTQRVVAWASVRDDGGTAASGVDTASVSLTSTVALQAVNDAPTLQAPSTANTPAGQAVTFSAALGNAITVADVDALTNPVRISLTATNGVVTLASTTGLSFTQGGGSASANIVATGTLAQVNAALAGLQWLPNSGFSGAGSLGVQINDQGHSGSGGALAANATVAIQVAAPPPPPPPRPPPPPAPEPPPGPPINITRSVEMGHPVTTTVQGDRFRIAIDPVPAPPPLPQAPNQPAAAPPDIALHPKAEQAVLLQLPDAGSATASGPLQPTVLGGDPSAALWQALAAVPRTPELVQAVADTAALAPPGQPVQVLQLQLGPAAGPWQLQGQPQRTELLHLQTTPASTGVVVLSAIEFVAVSGPLTGASGQNTADTWIANAAGQWLHTGPGADRLFGGAGNDTLAGGSSADLVDGGEGDDYLSGADSESAAVTFTLATDGRIHLQAQSTDWAEQPEWQASTPAGQPPQNLDPRLRWSQTAPDVLAAAALLLRTALGRQPTLEELAAATDAVNAQALNLSQLLAHPLVQPFVTQAFAPQTIAAALDANGRLPLAQSWQTPAASGWRTDHAPDTLQGGPGNDTLAVGPEGGDTLVGGPGTDTAVLWGNPAQFKLTPQGQPSDAPSSPSPSTWLLTKPADPNFAPVTLVGIERIEIGGLAFPG